MNLTSSWKITYDPAGSALVLLDSGDELAADLRWPLRRKLEIVDLVDSGSPFLRDSGNRVFSLRFEVFEDSATDALARQAIMESLIAIGDISKKPLKIEADGITDRYWQFADAVIGEHEPASVIEFGAPRNVKGYTITATGISQVGP